MGISIDNEDAVFKETTINGYKGYSYEKQGTAELIWTDGIYLYILQGTCELNVLEEMTKYIMVASNPTFFTEPAEATVNADFTEPQSRIRSTRQPSLDFRT